MNSSSDAFDWFDNKRKLLADIALLAADSFALLNEDTYAQNMKRLHGRVVSDRFRILVLGEFKRGKSTVINAMLGDDVLPAYVTPCTAVINEIKWGDEKRAIVHFRSPLPATLPSTMPRRAIEHIGLSRTDTVPPIEVGIDELLDYVVIPDSSMDQEDSVAESPYQLVELFWPLDFCKRGVEIIDSPGLNEHHTRTVVTTQYLSQADAIVFVMSCHALASQSEMNVLDRDVLGMGHEDIFFICNRFDEVRPADRERLAAHAKHRLAAKSTFKDTGIFFLSALQALEGKNQRDDNVLNQSGLPRFETALRDFLAEDRGRIKLCQPARELLHAVRLARQRLIPKRIAMLQSTLKELEDRYESAKPELSRLEARASLIVEQLKIDSGRLVEGVKNRVRVFIKDSALQAPKWVEDFDPEGQLRIDFLSFESTSQQARTLTKQIAHHITDTFQEKFSEWRKTVLEPEIQSGLQRMTDCAEVEIAQLLSTLDRVSAGLSGDDDEGLDGVSDISPLERALAAAGGYLVAGIGSAAVGAALGFKEMLKSLLPQIALLTVAIIAGLTNPLALIAVMMGGGTFQAMLSARQLTKVMKTEVAKKISDNLRSNADTTADEVATSIASKLQEFTSQVEQGLQNEIQRVRQQVEAVLSDVRKGSSDVEAAQQRLQDVEVSFSSIAEQLDDLLFALLDHATV